MGDFISFLTEPYHTFSRLELSFLYIIFGISISISDIIERKFFK